MGLGPPVLLTVLLEDQRPDQAMGLLQPVLWFSVAEVSRGGRGSGPQELLASLRVPLA